MHSIIADLTWRYATKKYNPSAKIAAEDLNTLKSVLSLVPSSNGLQPFKFLIIENPEVRAQLREKSYNQSQITDASHLIVMCAMHEIDSNYIDSYMQLNANRRNLPIENLVGFRTHLTNSVLSKSKDDHLKSNSRQVYIALGHLLHAAAQLRIDATPMEGFDPKGYSEVLGLEPKNLQAVVVCALGYRAEDDGYQHLAKVRKDLANLIETI